MRLQVDLRLLPVFRAATKIDLSSMLISQGERIVNACSGGVAQGTFIVMPLRWRVLLPHSKPEQASRFLSP